MKLPLNCEVEYFKDFLNVNDANELFIELLNMVENLVFSPHVETEHSYEFNFSKITFLDQDLLDSAKTPEFRFSPTQLWTDKLRNLKEKIEKHTHQTFHVCVLIYYPDGKSGVDFHSDYVAFGDTSIIPSISLGEERLFSLREKKTQDEMSLQLKHGSLIIMGKGCQERYEHSLPINSEYKKPRINLTFRKFGFDT